MDYNKLLQCGTCESLVKLLIKEKEEKELLRIDLNNAMVQLHEFQVKNLEKENRILRDELGLKGNEVEKMMVFGGGAIQATQNSLFERKQRTDVKNIDINGLESLERMHKNQGLMQIREEDFEEQIRPRDIIQSMRRREKKASGKLQHKQDKFTIVSGVSPQKVTGTYQANNLNATISNLQPENGLLYQNGNHRSGSTIQSKQSSNQSSYQPVTPRPRITARKRSSGAKPPQNRNVDRRNGKFRNSKGQFMRSSIRHSSAESQNSYQEEQKVSPQTTTHTVKSSPPITGRLKCPAPNCMATRGLIQSMKQHVRETKGGQGHQDVYCNHCDSVFFKPLDREEHDKLEDCIQALRNKNKAYLSQRQKELVKALQEADQPPELQQLMEEIKLHNQEKEAQQVVSSDVLVDQ